MPSAVSEDLDRDQPEEGFSCLFIGLMTAKNYNSDCPESACVD